MTKANDREPFSLAELVHAMQRPQPPDPLPTYFDSIVFDSAGLGPLFVLRCKVCHGEWKLPIKNQDPGNIQTILNHARSHPKQDN